MASAGRAKLKAIFVMLDHCLPGHTRKRTDHYWRVFHGDRAFTNLPAGEHGKDLNAEIEIGWIRRLVRRFEIEDCARRELEILR